jgi:small subunit ribosomal protein S24e
MAKSFVIRVRKFMTNKVLDRKQFHIDVFNADHENASRKDVAAEVARKYKVPVENVVIFNLESKFGGGRATGLGFIYNSKDALVKVEPKHRLLRNGFLEKKTTPSSRRLKKENKNKVKNLRGKAKVEKLRGGADKKKKK